jgi:imidazole glycerol-phosphate synthase subunit HisF
VTAIRLIARLDIKGPNLIKGIHLEGLRVIGDPQEFAQRYYEDGIDEIFYMDTVASLYGRNSLTDIVSRTAENVFVPITVGGGIRSIDDVHKLLRHGADKVTINTAAIKRPELIGEVAAHFGSQCMILGIEAKQQGDGKWVCFTDNGREATNLDVIQWAKEGVERGAGEIVLTSVDREGTCEGYDVDLIHTVSDAVSVPVIASGGMGNIEHLVEIVDHGSVTACAMAHVLHYGELSVSEIRNAAAAAGILVRSP